MILEQDRVGATVFARAGTDWPRQIVLDGETLYPPEIGVEPPLAELYEGVDFTDVGAPAES